LTDLNHAFDVFANFHFECSVYKFEANIKNLYSVALFVILTCISKV